MNSFVVTNGRFVYKNFSGTVNEHNPKGLRSFGVLLDDATADILREQGHHIGMYTNKWEKKKTPFLKVMINYNYYTKPLVLIGAHSGNRTKTLTEDDVSILDFSDLKESRLTVRCYSPKGADNKRTVAYLACLEVFDLFDLSRSGIFTNDHSTLVEQNEKAEVIETLNDSEEV